MAAYPSYLLRSRHSVFYFRIVVPTALRSLFSCREIRRSLQTNCQREALVRSRALLVQVQQMFTRAFQGERQNVASLRCAWELGGRVASWATWLQNHRLVVMAEEGASISATQRARTLKTPSQTKAAPTSPVFSKVVQECLQQQEKEGVSLKTLDDKRSVASLLIRIVGDRPIGEITRQHARSFRDTALQLPPRLYAKSEGQSLESIIRSAKSTISSTTFNNYVKNLTTFFSYAIREGYCERNPFDGLRLKQRGKVSEERNAFSSEDLRRIFSKEVYSTARKPFQYWLPLLGLYTGARLNELCQLYVDDVVVVNGIDCLHIRASRPDQRLKTVTSERLVPIHSRLKALGFLQFVEKQRAAGCQRVFQELVCHKKHGYSAGGSKWFARVRERLGFTGEDGKKDFHSFRHTFADHLKQKGVAESLVGGLLGHQSEGITFGRYGKDYRPEVLVPVVEQVTLESL